MPKQQQGFTLIELILVIVMLGTLAAFALPRFADLGRDARIASVEGAAASIRSAAAVAHAAWLVRNNVILDLEGTMVGIAAGGYPQAPNPGIIAAAGIDASNFQVVRSSAGSSTVTVLPLDVASTANCFVRYNLANSATAPTISVQTGGC